MQKDDKREQDDDDDVFGVLMLTLEQGEQPRRIPLPSPLPLTSSVWHYTTVDGLYKILGSGRLWASSTLSLNDASELVHGESVLRKRWKYLDKTSGDRDALDYLDSLMVSGFSTHMQDHVYLACASTDGDALNQWQHYAHAQGYAIRLSTSWLEPEPREPRKEPQNHVGPQVVSGWYRVEYDRNRQNQLADDLLSFLISIPNVGHPDYYWLKRTFVMVMGTLIAQMKHSAFAAEQEVRYIATDRYGDSVRFRPGARGLIPYLQLGKSASDEPEDWDTAPLDARLPVSAVRCGPASPSDRESVRHTLQRFLAQRGYQDVQAHTSVVPYRFS